MMNCPDKLPPTRIARHTAFSLIELLVVVAIMGILLVVAIPAIKALTQNNNQKQARNMASVYIAAARSAALQQRRLVGCVFYEDPTNKNQVAVRLVRETGVNADLTYFGAIPGSQAEFMPRAIRIGVLDDNTTWNVRTEQQATAEQRTRLILFDANGQLVLRNGLGVNTYDAGTTYNTGEAVASGGSTYVCVRPVTVGQSPVANNSSYWRREDWYIRATSSALNDGVSTPGIVIWDDNDFRAANLGSDAARGDWVLKNADILIVNAYTGNLLDVRQ